jgi:regulator of replication initiation timing
MNGVPVELRIKQLEEQINELKHTIDQKDIYINSILEEKSKLNIDNNQLRSDLNESKKHVDMLISTVASLSKALPK